jgi:hypothetical protein
MAKKRKRKYSRAAGRDVESEMRRYKRGTAKSGRGAACLALLPRSPLRPSSSPCCKKERPSPLSKADR